MAKQPYQVTAQDKDLATLSANLGIDYNAVKEANPYISSVSEGQYISIPSGSFSGATIGAGGSSTTTNADRFAEYQAQQILSSQQVNYSDLAAKGAQRVKLQSYQPPNGINYSQLAGKLTSSTPNVGNTASSYSDLAAKSGIQSVKNINILKSNFQSAYASNNPDLLPTNITMQQAIAAGVSQDFILNNYDPQPNGTYSPKGYVQKQPGSFYVDEKTKPFLGKVITVNGKQKRLMTDKNGKLYYADPGLRGRNRQEEVRRYAVAPRSDAPSTVLNVILGS